MNKSDIFDRKHPRPLEKELYPVYKEMRDLEQEVLKIWVQDLTSGRLGMRGFYDLTTARLETKRNGEAVISLKPVVGASVHSAFVLYTRFFNFYTAYAKVLEVILEEAIVTKQYAKIHDKPEVWKTWRKTNMISITVAISVIKIAVLSMINGTLTHDHLSVLEDPKTILEGQGDLIAAIDQIARDNNLTHVLSDKFEQGGHFYEEPEPTLVNAYWRYAYKKYARSLHNTVSV